MESLLHYTFSDPESFNFIKKLTKTTWLLVNCWFRIASSVCWSIPPGAGTLSFSSTLSLEGLLTRTQPQGSGRSGLR